MKPLCQAGGVAALVASGLLVLAGGLQSGSGVNLLAAWTILLGATAGAIAIHLVRPSLAAVLLLVGIVPSVVSPAILVFAPALFLLVASMLVRLVTRDRAPL